MVNWRAPATRRTLRLATTTCGLTRKRTFSCGKPIRYFTDVLFGQTGAGVDEFLLQERPGPPASWTRYHPGAQYDIIRAPLDRYS